MLTEQPEFEKKKNFHAQNRHPRNTPDFHIDGLSQDTLIDLQNGGLDDVETFNCDMYNIGDMDNLPESDQKMISKNQSCKEYRF